MILTTTNSIDGRSITDYLRPVSAHIVFGANIFSDISASFRDVFGGRSQSYQNQLEMLTDAALKELEQAAKKLSADAVVGMQLDYSEMSGGGKAGMFMVVATGTAVRLSGDGIEAQQSSLGRLIDGKEVQLLVDKSKYLRNLEAEPEALLETVSAATSKRAHEAFSVFASQSLSEYPPFIESFVAFLEMCEEEKGYPWLLETAVTHESVYIRLRCIAVLKTSDSFRLADLSKFLNSENVSNPALLRLAALSQFHYSSDDETSLKKLAKAVEERFPKTIRSEIRKSGLGRKKEVVLCQCGGKFHEGITRCDSCGKNQWGLPGGSVSPTTAVKNLFSIAEALAEVRATLEKVYQA